MWLLVSKSERAQNEHWKEIEIQQIKFARLVNNRNQYSLVDMKSDAMNQSRRRNYKKCEDRKNNIIEI